MNGIMTGTGTETDPYIIEDVYDFCTITSSDTETYYELKNNIDFNNHDKWKNGFNEVFVVNAPNAIINGNSKKIRNIVLHTLPYNNPVFYLNKIQNAFLENVVLNNIDSERGESRNQGIFACNFQLCSFSIDIINSQPCAIHSRNVYGISSMHKFEDCTFNIYGTTDSQSGINFHCMEMVRCHINFSDLISNGSGYNNHNVGLLLSSDSTVYNSVYFTGSIKYNGNRKACIGLSHYGTFDNCYFAVNVSVGDDITKSIKHATQFSPSISSLCFFVKDLIGDGTFNGSDFNMLINILDSQAKDISYLKSIGFPTIEVV